MFMNIEIYKRKSYWTFLYETTMRHLVALINEWMNVGYVVQTVILSTEMYPAVDFIFVITIVFIIVFY